MSRGKKTNKSVIERIDRDFKKALKDIAVKRVKNDVEPDLKRDRTSIREMTSLIQRAPSWNKIVKELSTLPRREDLR